MNPGDFSAFAASLKNLTKEEIRQAKVLYMKNAIIGYKSFCQYIPLFLLGMSSMSIFIFLNFITVFPFFALLALLSLYVEFSSTKNFLKYIKQKIANALEVWKEDLGDDYFKFKIELEKIKANIPIINIPLV